MLEMLKAFQDGNSGVTTVALFEPARRDRAGSRQGLADDDAGAPSQRRDRAGSRQGLGDDGSSVPAQQAGGGGASAAGVGARSRHAGPRIFAVVDNSPESDAKASPCASDVDASMPLLH
jgi:hypothetical protein